MNEPRSAVMTPAAREMRRRAAFGMFWVANSTLLSACAGSLLPKPAQPPARFTLDGGAPARAEQTADAGAPVLTVNEPRAVTGYDSRRMVYLRRSQELEAFAFHEWVATPAQMLTPLLVRGLQDSGSFRVVLSPPSAAAAGWRLETELLRLHQDFTRQPSRVRLSVRAVLLDGVTRQALAWRELDISVDATGDDPVSGALAAQVAAQQLVAALATFCTEQTRKAIPGRR